MGDMHILDLPEIPGEYLCEWTHDEIHSKWDTSCEQGFIFMKDGPRENDFLFCPFCGSTIKTKEDGE